jgi:multiple sugar transport system substrate-binding protein
VYYNKQIFADAGVTAEDVKDWTWDEYVQILRKVTVDKNGNHPGDAGFDSKKVKTWGTFVPTASYINEPLLWSNGGAYFEPDGSGLAVDRPESVEVLQKLTDLTFVEKVAPTSADMAGMSSQIKMLKDGRLASFISGTYDIAGFVSEDWYDYGVAELPIFKKSANQLWGEPVVIFESSKHKEAAFEFLQYLINPESSLKLAEEGSCIPAFKSWYTDPEKFASWADNKYHGDDFRALIPELATNCTATRSIYYVKNSDAVGNVIYSALDQCYLNNKPVQEIVKDLDQKAKPYLQGVWEIMPWID